MKLFPTCLATALVLLAPAAQAFDLRNLDIDQVQKAVSIGKKAVDANREIGEREEKEIGDGIAARVLGAAPLVKDARVQAYVNEVGRWLALQTGRADLDWHFGVVDSPAVNAFSMPGGTVLVTRGLYARLRNEAELAGVLAHEIAHVVERHQLRQIQKSLGSAWKMEVVQAVAENKGTQEAQHIARAFSAGTEILARGLDKRDEFEADRLGVVIAARGGYNPYGLVGVLQTLGAINPQDSAVALMFRTHPSPDHRLDRLGESMKARLDDYAGGIEQTRRFVRLAP